MSIIEQTSAIEIRDTRISLSEIGNGEPILFLHGNPGSRKDFAEIINGKPVDKFKFILPDRPGHMSSDEIINETNDPWLDIEFFAELIDRKCNGKVWLAAYSMGCYIACKIAIKHPDKIKGIIMMAPYLTPDNPKEKPSSIPNLSRGAFLGTFFGTLMPMLAQGKMQKHIENVFAPANLPEEYLETWLPRYTRFESLLAMMTDKNTMLESLNEVHQRMPEIKCPIQVLIGDKDLVCCADKQKKLLQEKMPHAQITSLPEGGHGLPLTHPTECLQAISDIAS